MPTTEKKKRKPRRHYVDAGGKKLPGVTTIMQHLGWSKNALIGWAHKLGREGRSLGERDEAASLGSCTHAVVAEAFGGEEVDPSEWRAQDLAECAPNAQRVIDLIRSRYTEVLAVEESITADCFGGTIDLVVRDGDAIKIVDLKTGKGIYHRENCVQLGAYAWLWRLRCSREDQQISIATAGEILHAPASGPLRAIQISPADLLAGEQIFRCLLDIDEAAASIATASIAKD